MKTFACAFCGGVVFFENDRCVRCDHALGFLAEQMEVATFAPTVDNFCSPLGGLAGGHKYRLCANGRDHSACNWYLNLDEPGELCRCCGLNLIIPDLGVPGNLERWRMLEVAKRRLVYSLLSLCLPISGFSPASNHQWPPLRFQFLARIPGGAPVPTAHQQGVITVDLEEADPVERERRRNHLREPQRTLLGHLRHESGHYYWGALIAGSSWAERFRSLFGDETADYDSALASYYAKGPIPGWEGNFISAYASSHPWEDWAETWAHYLHMIDLIETSQNYQLRPRVPAIPKSSLEEGTGGKFNGSMDEMLDHWFPLVVAANSLNRSMGLPDLYPFVLAGPVIEKLRFVHELVSARVAEGTQDRPARRSLADTSVQSRLQSATFGKVAPHSAPTQLEQKPDRTVLTP